MPLLRRGGHPISGEIPSPSGAACGLAASGSSCHNDGGSACPLGESARARRDRHEFREAIPTAPRASSRRRKTSRCARDTSSSRPSICSRCCSTTRKGMAAGLIERAGGRAGRSAARPSSAALAKRPKVSGGGAGQLYLAPELARVFDTAEKIADKAGDKFVTAERLLLALAIGGVERRQQHPQGRRRHAARRSTRPSTTSARAARPTARRPSRPMTR